MHFTIMRRIHSGEPCYHSTCVLSKALNNNFARCFAWVYNTYLHNHKLAYLNKCNSVVQAEVLRQIIGPRKVNVSGKFRTIMMLTRRKTT
jgi:hypothetical protein